MSYFVDGQNIFVATYSDVYFSINGGQTFTIATGNLPNRPVTGFAKLGNQYLIGIDEHSSYDTCAIYACNPSTGWNWTLMDKAPWMMSYSYIPSYLETDDLGNIYLFGFSTLYKLVGNTLQPMSFPTSNIIKFKPLNGKLYCTDNDGQLFRSDDYGTTWTDMSINGIFYPVHDVEEKDGWLYVAVGNWLVRSNNSGLNWEHVYKGIWQGSTGAMTSMNGEFWSRRFRLDENTLEWSRPNDTLYPFAISNHFKIAGYNNNTYLYTASTQTWQLTVPNFAYGAFLFGNYLFRVVGNDLHRISEGVNYTLVLNAPQRTFMRGQELFAWTSGGLLKSTDYGNTWTTVNYSLPAGAPNDSVFFTGYRMFENGSDLFAMDFGGGLYMSQDGAVTWNKVTANGLRFNNYLHFSATADHMFISGYNYGQMGSAVYKGIYHMPIGDTVWQTLDNDTTISVAEFLVHGNYFYSSHSAEGIKRRMISTVTSVQEPASAETTISIYPNPVTESVTVTLNNHFSGTTDIKLFDLQGREVYAVRLKFTDGSSAFTIPPRMRNGTYFLETADGFKGKLVVLR